MLLFVGVLMGALDIAIIGPALPAIQADFNLDGRQLAVLFNAYVLGQVIGTQPLAKLADRFGPRAIYILAITFFALGSLLLVIARDPLTMYAGRAIQGFGAGGIFPVATTVIAAKLSREDRGPALGLLGSVWGLAFCIGPVLGGILLNYSWRWLFVVNLPIAALLVVGAWKLLPATAATRRLPFDFAGAAALLVGLCALVLGLNNLDTNNIADSLRQLVVAIPLLIFVVLMPLFLWLETRAEDPIVRPGLLRSRQVTTAALIAAGAGAIQTATLFYPALAVEAIGVSESTAAFMLLPGVVVATIGAVIVGKLINTVGTRLLILFSLVLMGIGLVMFGQAQMNLATFIVATMISALGSAGLVGAPIRWTILNESRPDERAAAQGLLSNITSVGRLMGAATVGATIASKGGGVPGYQSAFIGAAILGSLLFLLSMTLKSRRAEQATTHGEPAPASA